MKRAIAVAIALACAACGNSSDAPDASGVQPRASGAHGRENEAPTIESAVLTPDPASAADGIAIDLEATDPDRDRLTTQVEWFKNGELMEDLHETAAPSGTFNRGDRVYATIHLSDASHEVTRQTPAITIENAVPRIRSVYITPPLAAATDVMEARVDVSDADGDSLELSYRWYKNGVEIPGVTGARLPTHLARRGDKIGVEASATDGSDSTDWVTAPVVALANAKPTITTQPGYEMGPTGVYSYELAAKDPDGDEPLRYELLQGPKGMTVDGSSGVVTWTVPQDAKGNNAIEVAVSDAYGGRVTQSWVLSVDWNQPPANAAETKTPARTPAPAAVPDESGIESESGDDETPPKRVTAPAAKPAPAKVKAGDDDSEQDEAEETDDEEF